MNEELLKKINYDLSEKINEAAHGLSASQSAINLILDSMEKALSNEAYALFHGDIEQWKDTLTLVRDRIHTEKESLNNFDDEIKNAELRNFSFE